MDRAELISVIKSWLFSERMRVFAAAQKMGLPGTIRQQVPECSNISETSLDTGYVEIEVSPLGQFEHMLLPLLKEEQFAREVPIQVLVDEFGERLHTFTLAPMLSRRTPDRFASLMLATTLRAYLRHIKSFAWDDPELAGELVADLISSIERDDFDLVSWLPIAGLRGDTDDLRIEEFRFRRLTPRELGAISISRLPGDLTVGRRRLAVPGASGYLQERWVLEIRERSDKKQQPRTRNLLVRAVLALQLLGFMPIGEGHISQWIEPGPCFWSQGGRVHLPRYAVFGSAQLTRQQAQHALELARQLPEELPSHSQSRSAIALHRFHLGSAEEGADALIDYVIALEALLLPGTQRDELRFRFRLNGARFLASSKGEREQLFKALGEIYDKRSALVHGAVLSDPATHPLTMKARDLARRGLLKAVEAGWPSADDFQKESLS